MCVLYLRLSIFHYLAYWKRMFVAGTNITQSCLTEICLAEWYESCVRRCMYTLSRPLTVWRRGTYHAWGGVCILSPDHLLFGGEVRIMREAVYVYSLPTTYCLAERYVSCMRRCMYTLSRPLTASSAILPLNSCIISEAIPRRFWPYT